MFSFFLLRESISLVLFSLQEGKKVFVFLRKLLDEAFLGEFPESFPFGYSGVCVCLHRSPVIVAS